MKKDLDFDEEEEGEGSRFDEDIDALDLNEPI
jgi:hypothetical protein